MPLTKEIKLNQGVSRISCTINSSARLGISYFLHVGHFTTYYCSCLASISILFSILLFLGVVNIVFLLTKDVGLLEPLYGFL